MDRKLLHRVPSTFHVFALDKLRIFFPFDYPTRCLMAQMASLIGWSQRTHNIFPPWNVRKLISHAARNVGRGAPVQRNDL